MRALTGVLEGEFFTADTPDMKAPSCQERRSPGHLAEAGSILISYHWGGVGTAPMETWPRTTSAHDGGDALSSGPGYLRWLVHNRRAVNNASMEVLWQVPRLLERRRSSYFLVQSLLTEHTSLPCNRDATRRVGTRARPEGTPWSL